MVVALGGGYLIRAMTDAGALPALGGVALGLAYALLWLGAADRAAGAGRRASAGFHGLTSGLIAYPLLWETTTRFHLLSPPVALAILVLLFGAGIAITARHRLGSMAWVVTSLALGTTAGLLFSTRHLLAAVLALLAMGAVVEGLAFRDLWLDLRWPTALVLDAAVVALVLVGSRPAGLPEGYPALPMGAAVAATLGLAALYTASIVARTLGRGCPVTAFELAQGTAALVLGLAGAWDLLAARGAATTALGGLSLLLGALSYAAAFAFVERRTGHGRNFYFYSTVGSLLTLVGSRAILEDAALSVTWCLLALASAWLGRRFARITLRFHGALYLGAAAFVTDLLAASWRAFLAPAGSWPLPGLAGWITAATAVAGYAILASESTPSEARLGAAPPGRASPPSGYGSRAERWWRRWWRRLGLASASPRGHRHAADGSAGPPRGRPRGRSAAVDAPRARLVRLPPAGASAASSWSPRTSGRAGRPPCS